MYKILFAPRLFVFPWHPATETGTNERKKENKESALRHVGTYCILKPCGYAAVGKYIMKDNTMVFNRVWLKILIMFLLFGITLAGCASVPVSTPKESTSRQVINAVEVLGRDGIQFQGRVLRITSQGNIYTSAFGVRENALDRATWETYQLGYEYFIILSEDGSASQNLHTTPGSARTTTIGENTYTTYTHGSTYTTTSHSVVMVILCCSEDELSDGVPTFSVYSRLFSAQYYFNNNIENPSYKTFGTVIEYFNNGIEYAEKGDYDRAIKEYTETIRLNPNCAGVYFFRGFAYGQKNDHDRAIADYTEMIRLNSNDAVAYNARGWEYALKGDYDQAIEDSTESLRLKPAAYTYHTRGYAYLEKGEYDQAIADFEAALRIDPNEAEAKKDLERARQMRSR
ncbi:MAG: tetratricopeptide repeat protein [Treponema sp.]|nr:tetratricopeptide repeat protein [Treponema sp.]